MIASLQKPGSPDRRDHALHHSDITPSIYKITRQEDEDALRELLGKKPHIIIIDQIISHLRELMKITHPSEKLSESRMDELADAFLGGADPSTYGVWVYYPWLEKLVHLPEEEDFKALRTNRNRYKITPEEQASLSTKKIGIIGLSVGQSVALAMAMERSFGSLRIADFDSLEISNMNRIRTGVQNLGLPKTVIVAREIAEIDPFIQVSCYHEGISTANIDSFIHDDGSLDLLIDECDSLDIKILARQKARKAHIPVIMDTSDRGMIDIERFDLEHDRPLFHGLIEESLAENVLQDPAMRVQLSLQIAGADQISERMKASLPHIGKTISTWPQLASSVMLGGAAAAELSRKLLLDETVPSGRFYIDVEKIVKETR